MNLVYTRNEIIRRVHIHEYLNTSGQKSLVNVQIIILRTPIQYTISIIQFETYMLERIADKGDYANYWEWQFKDSN